MDRFPPPWNATDLSGVDYSCGYCGTHTTPSKGWISSTSENQQGFILICTKCNSPTFISRNTLDGSYIKVVPAAKMGHTVSGLPPDVEALYDEARASTSTGAYTGAVLLCRKLLMHVAVEKQAVPGQQFIDYVNYLAQNGYIPPDGKGWLDYIRTKSNEANHEIVLMTPKDADDLISFSEMLLRLVYEFKSRLP